MDSNFYSRHSKVPRYQHPKSTTTGCVYHPPTYTRNYSRQGESPFLSQNSTLFWHEGHKQISKPTTKSRGKYCSIALAAATFLVLIAVLAIAGLAFYMGALRTESTTMSPLVTFVGKVRVARGDRFIVGLTDKARRYKMQLETLYQRSSLAPAFVACSVDKFGNDTRTFYFRISLNRRKVPKTVHNLEKSIKDILISDASSRKPLFGNVVFDSRNIYIRRVDSGADLYQRTLPKTKETKRPTTVPATLNGTAGVLQKSTPSTLGGTRLMSSPSSSIETKEPSVVQGTFKISKTEADITENKSDLSAVSPGLVLTRPQSSLSSKLKETYVTSALFKLASGEKSPTTTTMSTFTGTSTKAATTTEPVVSTISRSSTTSATTRLPNAPLFANTANVYNQEPWVPIYHQLPNEEVTTSDHPVRHTVKETSHQLESEPVYTSFTNQRLSWYNLNPDGVTSKYFQGHPLPVNKLPITSEVPTKVVHITTEEPSSDFTETFTEGVEKLMIANDNSRKQLNNVASSVGTFTTKFVEAETKPPTTSSINFNVSTERAYVGLVEVVDADEASLLMQTTKLPLVTLMPVKSNSGVGRPVRPRPKLPHENETTTENRSFPSNLPYENHFLRDPIKYVETEVVTSVSSQQTRVKATKNQVDNFNIMSVLNFATESSSSTRDYPHHQLTADKIKELSKISKLNGNDTSGTISTKAVSSGSQHNGFNLLTKTFNKVPNYGSDKQSTNDLIAVTGSEPNVCNENSFKCGDGQCLPNSTRCNNLLDCSDGSDEKQCNCADYLRSQFLIKKICDGIVDCWDFSDENRCDWCTPEQYVCSNSKVCINRTSICDGIADCPHGDDERQCVTVAPDLAAADDFSYHSEGYLMVRKRGAWGKLCAQNFVTQNVKIGWTASDLGQAVCKAMTYSRADSANVLQQQEASNNQSIDYQETLYYQLSFNNGSRASLTFESSKCEAGEVVSIKCGSLECGARPQMSTKKNARIVGGSNAGLGAWPWQAALYKEGEFQCGGTLISDKWLLSAGHCFYHSQKDHWVARLGNLRRGTSLPSPYEQLRTIVKIILHPSYVDVGFINDIALLKMQAPVTFSDYVRPICLPKVGVAPQNGKICTVVGWGQLFEIGRIFPDTLQEVQVPIISTTECRKRTLFLPLYQVTDDMFCAGYDRGGRDACLGDSGGPLMCSENDGRWVLHGITSNGYGCARAYRPGVYTKVSHYISWIHAHTDSSDNDNDSGAASAVHCIGHRCPLGECLPKSHICNGFIECSDRSDESDCSDANHKKS